MKESIDRRLTHLEMRAGLQQTKWVEPFCYIADPKDPERTEEAVREAEQHQLEHPGALIICRQIVSPRHCEKCGQIRSLSEKQCRSCHPIPPTGKFLGN
jgi:hypothetical protein